MSIRVKSGSSGYISDMQSCIVNKETTDVYSYQRDALVRQSIIMLALLNEFVYEYRGTNTYVTSLNTSKRSQKKSVRSYIIKGSCGI